MCRFAARSKMRLHRSCRSLECVNTPGDLPQTGAVGGLENEADAIGHGQVLRAVPAGIVDLKPTATL
jgi:hypothetical protein